MVGLTSDYDDLILIVGVIILAPLVLIFGIPAFLASLGANTFVVVSAVILNIALVGYLIYRSDVIHTIGEKLNPKSFDDY